MPGGELLLWRVIIARARDDSQRHVRRVRGGVFVGIHHLHACFLLPGRRFRARGVPCGDVELWQRGYDRLRHPQLRGPLYARLLLPRDRGFAHGLWRLHLRCGQLLPCCLLDLWWHEV